jgi:carbon monoxide dehydrogenase subunit G
MSHDDTTNPAADGRDAESSAAETTADGTDPEETAPEGGDERGDRLEFSDAVRIETTSETLWATISDPATLTECVPGAESIERVSERKYTVDITRGLSHLTVSLSGEAEFVEMDPPEHVVTSATAFDSKTGSDFDILAAMEIQETDDGATELVYTAEVSISGGVATMSNRVLRPIVNRDIDTYFQNIKAEVEDDGT